MGRSAFTITFSLSPSESSPRPPHILFLISHILPFIPFVPFLLLFSCLTFILAPFVLPRARFLPALVLNSFLFTPTVTCGSHAQLHSILLSPRPNSPCLHTTPFLFSPHCQIHHTTASFPFVFTHNLLHFSQTSCFPFQIPHTTPTALGSKIPVKNTNM